MSNPNLELGIQSDLSIFNDTMVEMTWVEVQQSAADGAIVLFPVGIIEAHGPHLDLSPDVYLAYLFCKYLKQTLANKGILSIIAPPYYWGVSEDLKKYPGTFSVRPETFKAMLVDIFTALDSFGFKNVFICNSHGDPTHIKTIASSIKEVQQDLAIKVSNLADLDIPIENPPVFPPPREGRFKPDVHAGAIETASMFAFYPQKVNVNLAKELTPQKGFDPLGYRGDPASFYLEKDVFEYYRAELETDSLKIEAILKQR